MPRDSSYDMCSKFSRGAKRKGGLSAARIGEGGHLAGSVGGSEYTAQVAAARSSDAQVVRHSPRKLLF